MATAAAPSKLGLSRAELLEGSVLPLILRLAAPTVAVIAVQTIAAIVETRWMAKLGISALAGAALVGPMIVLMSTMSAGGIGGGVSSAIARALGADDRAAAERLLWHSLWLSLAFGSFFTLLMFWAGPVIFAALGGEGEALKLAVTYSNWMFASSIPMWAVNLIAAALRGAGDPAVPARVTLIGAVASGVLTPLLMFGVGPLPEMGVAGAGAAIGIYYTGALAALLWHLAYGRGVLKLRVSGLQRAPFEAILRVGLAAAFNTLLTNITLIAVTGAVGHSAPEALAGYGIAARLDTILIPPLFGLGTAIIALVGAAVGAGKHERARAVARTGAVFAAVVTEAIGLSVAFFPELWTGLFTDDQQVAGVAAYYLRAVAPFYGALGFGLLLYFAAQGTGRLGWPVAAGVARLVVAAGGGWLVATAHGDLIWVFAAVALGTLVFGAVNLSGFIVERTQAELK